MCLCVCLPVSVCVVLRLWVSRVCAVTFDEGLSLCVRLVVGMVNGTLFTSVEFNNVRFVHQHVFAYVCLVFVFSIVRKDN